MMGLIALALGILVAFIIWRCVEGEIRRERDAAHERGFERGSDEGFYRGYAQGRLERDE
jgi:peptidoglycan/LPS O-acetylase OafA/YrhL